MHLLKNQSKLNNNIEVYLNMRLVGSQRVLEDQKHILNLMFQSRVESCLYQINKKKYCRTMEAIKADIQIKNCGVNI